MHNAISSTRAHRQLILVGDHNQLGPIVKSNVALTAKLDVSLMERLYCSSDVYKFSSEMGDYNPAAITMLRICYRCHTAILEQPKVIFYESNLRCEAKVDREMLNCNLLVVKNFPIIFHGINGSEERDYGSPSWFNSDEVEIVVHYVQKLLEESNIPVRGEDIGVIAPYQKQVKKIKHALLLAGKHNSEYESVLVGSCEQFQGKERRVIIISTVRSSSFNELYEDKQQQNHLGFLTNPKRFNVAITRAKALLIIVGDPSTLDKDSNWKKMIQYCVDQNVYQGQSKGSYSL